MSVVWVSWLECGEAVLEVTGGVDRLVGDVLDGRVADCVDCTLSVRLDGVDVVDVDTFHLANCAAHFAGAKLYRNAAESIEQALMRALKFTFCLSVMMINTLHNHIISPLS